MFAALRQNWEDFKAAPPGRRFQDIHKKRKDQGQSSTVRRWALLILGIALAFTGFFFMLVPGPGLLIAAPGLALIAGESLTVAKILDWLERKLRPLFEWAKSRWDGAKGSTKIALASVAVLLGGAVLVASYYLFYA